MATINVIDLFKIVNVECHDPHGILGMHEIEKDDKNCVAVREFIPQAKSIIVKDESGEFDEPKEYEMEKIHEDGFFEVIIPDRSKWFKYSLKITNHEGGQWDSYDAYSFAPTISEYDRYLFGAGNHYRIYQKLGAHPMVVDGVEGVSFGVWAPNAKSVSVIGDFNSWDERRHQMRILGESGIWEMFIPGLKEGDKYKYRVKAQNNNVTDKCDPYGNYAEVRPKTANIVYDINKYKWNDSDWIDYRKNTDFNCRPMNIYEIHLGSWMRVPEEDNRSLTYAEAADKIVAYVKDMGYTHIELLPVEEHPFDGSWGYQVTGYYAPTSRFGEPVDFKLFVDKCHQNNIGVILDWVPAHFPKDSFGLARFDGTALYEHEDPRQGEHPDWGTLIYNYGRNEVRNFLIANGIFWIREYHIDAIRVDAVASMLYLDYGKSDGGWIPNERGGKENLTAVEFLKHMNSIISKEHPGALVMAEESTSWAGVTAPTEYGGLGFSMKWNMGWMHDFLEYIKKDCIYRKYHHNSLTFSMVYAYTEKFILVLSHDEVVHGKCSMISKMPGDMWQKFANARVSYGFMYSHPGKKLLFMGAEFGQFSEWSEAKSLDWHLLEYDNHANLKNYMHDLNHLYKSEPALWKRDFDPNGFEWIDCGDANNSIVSYIRRGDQNDDELLIVCNFTPETHFDFRVGVNTSGTYREVFNSDEEKYGGSGVINRKDIVSNRIDWNNRQNSIGIKVPPLGIVIFKRLS